MELPKSLDFDEARYRNEVLLHPSEESEIAHEQSLIDEARQLGLRVPEVEVVTSLAASIASGMVDLSSPVLSSGSSTDRNSSCDVTPSHETPPFDQIASSLSEFTIASEPAKCGSTRSIASLSTRPTSYSSSEGRVAHIPDNVVAPRPPEYRHSLLSFASSEKKQRRRSSLKSAIGKIHFRKRRYPSSVLLPPAAQITVTRGDHGVDKVYVESKPDESQGPDAPEDENQLLRLEIPLFDNESLQRALADVELKQMREDQCMERNRHVAFHDAFMSELRRNQQAVIAERLPTNKLLEDEKREKNEADAILIEERQLTVEMDQMREFERMKMNSRTRIKYMEGYFSNASPPSPEATALPQIEPGSPARTFTPQQKAQLAQEYHDHKSMDQLHEAKIKVLRDRQEIRLQEGIARMARELDDMIDKHALEFAELQRAHRDEESAFLQVLEAKKAALRHRWNLEEAVLRKKLEDRHGLPYGPLPPLSFSDSHYETRDSAICVSDHTGTPSGDEDPTHQKRGGPLLDL
ncbi:hypothetical protein FE257_006971 [Aspergillus nanangensis]|uniref:Uncharacterized protein n=1 Tax=Aspergillus nanangensis TaxID=2582783 RepID=A0AAD4CNR6_ASPNN|nr:hypothetical protein FE257_006971 [Aspergillus nanangensis]